MVDWGSALLVAVLGLGTVFIVLAILMFILMLMEKIFYKKGGEAEAPAPAAPAAQPVEVSSGEGTDEGELVAVLTAAVAASLKTSAYNLQIKSYRKLSGASSVWNNASRKENVYGRLS